jgi:hypothetical protein
VVVRFLAKEEVEGSNPFSRSKKSLSSRLNIANALIFNRPLLNSNHIYKVFNDYKHLD